MEAGHRNLYSDCVMGPTRVSPYIGCMSFGLTRHVDPLRGGWSLNGYDTGPYMLVQNVIWLS